MAVSNNCPRVCFCHTNYNWEHDQSLLYYSGKNKFSKIAIHYKTRNLGCANCYVFLSLIIETDLTFVISICKIISWINLQSDNNVPASVLPIGFKHITYPFRCFRMYIGPKNMRRMPFLYLSNFEKWQWSLCIHVWYV